MNWRNERMIRKTIDSWCWTEFRGSDAKQTENKFLGSSEHFSRFLNIVATNCWIEYNSDCHHEQVPKNEKLLVYAFKSPIADSLFKMDRGFKYKKYIRILRSYKNSGANSPSRLFYKFVAKCKNVMLISASMRDCFRTFNTVWNLSTYSCLRFHLNSISSYLFKILK